MGVSAALAGVAVLVMAMTGGRAEACDCEEPPLRNELYVGQGFVPVNAPGIPWWFTRGDRVGELGDVLRMEHVADDGAEAVDTAITRLSWGSYVAGPSEGWSVGETYRVEVDLSGAVSGPENRQFASAEFEIVGPLMSAPPELRTSQVTVDEIQVEDTDGACTDIALAAYVDLELVLPDLGKVRPAQLHFATLVDGRPWTGRTSLCSEVEPGRSWQSLAGDRVFARCESGDEDELALGTHRVQMEARLPGTDIVYASEEVTVSLGCDEEGSGCGVVAGGSSAPGRLASLLALVVLARRRHSSTRQRVRRR